MIQLHIPMPLLVCVDDVGWWSGKDGAAVNQPFRTGMKRDHGIEDYEALIALASSLDMKIPTGFILCEWDRTGFLKQLPSATWMGNQWQGSLKRLAEKEKAASMLRGAESFLEPALHGIGHEFWIDGRMDRTEFHTASGKMRDADEVEKHLEFFFRLLDQYGFNFNVQLFIPPALNHSFGDGKFQRIARSFGIRYVTLVFDRARCLAQPQMPGVGWEEGVVLLDRGSSAVHWNQTSPKPEFDFNRPVLTLHWANILADNPLNNMAVVKAWADFIQTGARKNGMLLVRDIADCLTQYLNATQSEIRQEGRDFVVHMDWIHKIPEGMLGDAVFFALNTSKTLETSVCGAEMKSSSRSAESGLLKVGLPKTGKLVFRFCEKAST